MTTDLYKFKKPGELLYAVQELKKSHPDLTILPFSDELTLVVETKNSGEFDLKINRFLVSFGGVLVDSSSD